MTKTTCTKKNPARKYAPGTSRTSRSVRTLALRMAEEIERHRATGERIKQRREALRLTQPVVADRVGVTLRAYQVWEAGEGGVAWSNLPKLAEVLGVSEDWLLLGDPDENATSLPQLDRIETMLGELLIRVQRLEDAIPSGAESLEDELSSGGQPPARRDDDNEEDEPEPRAEGD